MRQMRLRAILVFMLGVNLLGCNGNHAAECSFHPKSGAVSVGTTQTVKVGLNGMRYIDFAGSAWTPSGRTAATLPPVGTEVEVTLVSQASAVSGTARARLSDGSTIDLGVPGCA